jgi:threonine dehydrogenase-like Zn-dependent dehydrogenase
MKALCVTDGGLTLSEVPAPKPRGNEALVRVSMAGVCTTDLEIVRGYMHFRGILGHEFVGRVDQTNDPRMIGRRVVGEINVGCGTCRLCKRKLERHCNTRAVLGISEKDGCFAEYLTLPLRNLHRVPDVLEDKLLCFVEPIAACYEMLEQVTVMQGDRVAVLGDGKLGILAAQVLNHLCADTVLVGINERKLAVARSCGLLTARSSELEPKSFDLVVEATGASAGMCVAVKLVRPRGPIILKSTYHGDLVLNAAQLVIDEIKVVGSRCGPFEPAIAALAGGAVNVLPLIDAVFPLDEGVAAIKDAQRPERLKVLIAMNAKATP